MHEGDGILDDYYHAIGPDDVILPEESNDQLHVLNDPIQQSETGVQQEDSNFEVPPKISAYHYPYDSTEKKSQYNIIPERPWFLEGGEADPEASGRGHRIKKDIVRFTPESSLASLAPTKEEMWNAIAALPSQLRVKPQPKPLSVKKALSTLGETATKSIDKELRSMLDKGVFKGVKRSELSEKEWNSIIKSHMFLREKQVPEYKLKSRFVGGGDGQNKALYGEERNSCPPVPTQS